MELQDVPANRYTDMALRDSLFLQRTTISKSLVRVCGFIPTFFIVMALQQRSRLTQRLPYAMTHRYFLVLPVLSAFTLQDVLARSMQKKINQQYVRDMGYAYDENSKQWVREGPATKAIRAGV
ncbi:hypothetical protein RvY_14691 [Ramazzottius varieornatus]|uniref:Uncharacterized protein n=1 Tax=Ramazzottius varieornatus TaxID=947166 RepID=A0A1D1W0J7_RAMVA|nr:hypothetical protein RvY_14691 [Ramazzottius varieornatus]